MALPILIRQALWNMFLADSHALGVHWCYFSDTIAEKIGRVGSLVKPTLNDYHPTKEAGDLSHYGDQTLVLLEELKKGHKFVAEEYSSSWVAFAESYNGYRDGSMKDTLATIKSGTHFLEAGAKHSDVSSGARVLPLLAIHNDEESLVKDGRLLTSLNYNTPMCLDFAELILRSAFRVLHNDAKPTVALREAASLLEDKSFLEKLEKGFATKDLEDEAAIRSLGPSKEIPSGQVIYFTKACGIEFALSGIAHFVAKYEDGSVEDALVGHAGVGGDTCPRASIIAVLLSRRGSLPESWNGQFRHRERIEAALNSF
eukprot:TRINITY_DN4580_c0_g1_i1.p1 TRINITY_DN4580_c0_g1~~TRINITY_DN4580_c0_g1_i1.p1  ORF type:complete len:314 (-),score=78.00 TRINITY_DN4580_c0_g1_i1:70-1011(-)